MFWMTLMILWDAKWFILGCLFLLAFMSKKRAR